MRLNEEWLALRRIAVEWAKEIADEPGGLSCDEISDAIFRSIVGGQFAHGAIALAKPPLHGTRRGPPDGLTKPRFRDSLREPTDEHRWRILSQQDIRHMVVLHSGVSGNLREWSSERLGRDLHIDDLDRHSRNVFMNDVFVRREVFGAWCDRQEFERPKFWFSHELTRGPQPDLVAESVVSPNGFQRLVTAFFNYATALAKSRGVLGWRPDRFGSRATRPPRYSPDDSEQAGRWNAILAEAERNYLAELAEGRRTVTVFDDSPDRKGEIPQDVWRQAGIADLLYLDRIRHVMLPEGCPAIFSRFEGCRLFVPKDRARKFITRKRGEPKSSTLERNRNAYDAVEAALGTLAGNDLEARVRMPRKKAIAFAARHSKGEWTAGALKRADKRHRDWLKGQEGKTSEKNSAPS